jgi:trk system potassium uptake protein TrkA
MRVVFVGAGNLAFHAAAIMRSRDHEVVIIEQDKERIDELANFIDCGFIHGDGGKPAILKEAGPKSTDYLFCLTGNDQANIIASLVGRSLGFVHTVTKIEDAEFEHVCLELGLENTIVPSETIGRYLADMLEGESPLALSALIKGDARVLSFIAREEDAVPVKELGLPQECRVMFLYRGDKFIIADDDTALKEGDEVVAITRDTQLDKLLERWHPA